MNRFRIVAAAIALCLTAFSAQAERGQMGMVTGPNSGTYLRFGQDIARAAEDFGLTLTVKESNGSLENVKRMSKDAETPIGIVQSDLLGFLKRSKDPAAKELSGNLKVLYPFYPEEVHLLARKEVKGLSDLSGKRIAVGAEGSGHWVTAMNIITLMEVRPAEVLRLAPAEAASAVLQGKADAMFFVGGKPVRLFDNMETLKSQGDAYAKLLQNVHFLPLDNPKLLKEYSQSSITKADYSFVSEPVPTIAVTAVLMGYDGRAKEKSQEARSERCKELGKLGLALRLAFPDLQKSGHPKWKEVKLDDSVALWPKDECVDSIRTAVLKGASPLEDALLETMQQR